MIREYVLAPELSMEIECTKCGLTMRYEPNNVYTGFGANITLGQTVTWTYSDAFKQPLDVWRNGACFNENNEDDTVKQEE